MEFNHTIINVVNKKESALFFSDILGLQPPESAGYFLVLRTSNDVSLDFVDSNEPIQPQHFASRVTEEEFDKIFFRIKERGLTFWADPSKMKIEEIYTHNGGRGIYFEDPSKHLLEVLTWI